MPSLRVGGSSPETSPGVSGDLMFLSIFIALIAVQRLLELRLSRGHELALRAKGAYERGAGHYPLIVVLHAAWLLATLVEGWLRGAELSTLWPLWVALFLGGQALRYWAILSLGERWTTRVIVLPGAPLVRSGPYKFLPHPNYLAVMLEIFAVPLMFGAWITAGVFTLLNAGVLLVRVRAEERALGKVSWPC
ncbi:MAG TPA: isoprenylcysteine carboxyl methyltransferase family protein [Rubrobacter sp.]|nr:isoprenylcysteine carboxyl methyltransferase family protein [Rubrobacter sp.]